MKSAFFLERTTAPSWSSRCSRKTSTSSPSFRLFGSLNSSIGTAPSDLKPTSRITAASVTRRTLDLTISPSSMFERVPSYSSVIFAMSSAEYSSWRSDRTRSTECVEDFLGGNSTHSVLRVRRSEEHTSELQSRRDLVCRLLLEEKKPAGTRQHS